MKIAQINISHYGSTGKIMLQIADQARARGHECKTFSRAWKNQTAPNPDHAFFGSYLSNGFAKTAEVACLTDMSISIRNC